MKNKFYQSIVKNCRRLLVLLLVLSNTLFCNKKSNLIQNDQYIVHTLKDFLSFTSNSFLKRESIEDVLYDIQGPKATMGRAVHIGNRLFLTANHVINKNYLLQLVHQSKRGKMSSKKGLFTVLFKSKKYDLALLKMKNKKPIKKAKIHLFSAELKSQTPLSQFVYYKGPNPSKKEEFILEYDGLDYYDNVKLARKVGKFIFLKNSNIFEKQGFIWEFNFPFFKKNWIK